MRRDYVDRSLAGIAGPPTVDLATITSGTSGPAVGAAPFGERTLVCYSTANTYLPIARFVTAYDQCLHLLTFRGAHTWQQACQVHQWLAARWAADPTPPRCSRPARPGHRPRRVGWRP